MMYEQLSKRDGMAAASYALAVVALAAIVICSSGCGAAWVASP